MSRMFACRKVSRVFNRELEASGLNRGVELVISVPRNFQEGQVQQRFSVERHGKDTFLSASSFSSPPNHVVDPSGTGQTLHRAWVRLC